MLHSPLFYDFEMKGDAGASFSYAFTENLVLDAGYSVASDAAGNPDGQGLFSGGGQSYIAQITHPQSIVKSCSVQLSRGLGE